VGESEEGSVGLAMAGPRGLLGELAEAHTLLRAFRRLSPGELERRGLLERDEEQAWLSEDGGEASPPDGLLGASITYRIAVGPQRGEKAFTLRTLPPADEDSYESDKLARLSGFSLHAGITTRARTRSGSGARRRR
jgi:hypothetical protein